MSGARLDDHDDDDDDIRGGTRHEADVIDVPRGLVNNGGGAGGDDFDIVETDEQFRPLSGPGSDPRQEIHADDGNEDTETRGERRTRQRTRRENQRRLAEENQRLINEQRDTIQRLEAESKQFRETVSGRFTEFDRTQFEGRIGDVERQIADTARMVDAALDAAAEAQSTGDSDAFKRAMREHTKLVSRGFELTTAKTQLENARQQAATAQPAQVDPPADTRRQPQPPPRQVAPDPEVISLANDFRGRHPWIITNPAMRPDLDSKIAMIIDHEVAQEFDPRDPEYWEELEARLKDRLPHRYETRRSARQQDPRGGQQPAQRQQQQVPTTRRGPMVSGGGGNGNPNGGGGRQRLLLSPERKQAMIQVGALEADGRTVGDRNKFDRLAASYAKYDRDNQIASG